MSGNLSARVAFKVILSHTFYGVAPALGLETEEALELMRHFVAGLVDRPRNPDESRRLKKADDR